LELSKMVLENASKLELVCHSVALLVTLAGAILVCYTVNDVQFTLGEQNSMYFLMSIACMINFLLLVNANRVYPSALAITVALGFYWFPKGILVADDWRHRLDADSDIYTKSELRQLLSGAVLALTGTFAGILIEAIFPKTSKFKAPLVWEFLVFAGSCCAEAGCIAVWVYNTDKTQPFYSQYQTIAIQATLGLVFSIDAAFFPDADLIMISLFMDAYTFVNGVYEGMRVKDIPTDTNEHLHKALIGLLVMGFGLFIIMLSLGATHAAKDP